MVSYSHAAVSETSHRQARVASARPSLAASPALRLALRAAEAGVALLPSDWELHALLARARCELGREARGWLLPRT